jgi:hypothetical protein
LSGRGLVFGGGYRRFHLVDDLQVFDDVPPLFVSEFRTDDAFGAGRGSAEFVTGIGVSWFGGVNCKAAGDADIHIANVDGIEFRITNVECFGPLFRGKQKGVQGWD